MPGHVKKKAKRKPKPSMLGSGMARGAAKAAKQRHRRLKNL